MTAENIIALSQAQQDPRPPVFSDDALALRFAERHAERLRYVAGWGKWLEWDGKRWRTDATLQVFDLGRKICRDAAAECNNPKVASVIASAKTVAAVEKLARCDRRLAATVDQWDGDIWLLNTPAGTVDLRTGKMHEHRREDYCTRITAAAPAGECPTWHAFLDRITAGNTDLVLFLQRMSGYCLTGSTREHALFFGHGTGGNGKSVFITTAAGIMGDYATTAPMEAFTATTTDRHPTEIAGLRGARLVTATETEEGRRWAESKIKTLTGGDKISARFMRQDFFEFIPQFKLLVVGNHKPGLRGVDEAIRRRMNLIPFTVTIPAEERDDQLGEKLKAEWAGILQWMIEGCAEWQGEGLAQPAIVREATEAYLAAEDALALWIEECCVERPNAFATGADLFESWKKWADDAGERVGGRKQFSQILLDRGFAPDRVGGTGTRGFRGLRLKVAYAPD